MTDLDALRGAADALRYKPRRDEPREKLGTDPRAACPPAAQSTIDALMYSLRSGTAVLECADVKQRIAAANEGQLHDICKQLKDRNPAVAKSWSKDEIGKPVTAWARCHGE